MSSSEEPVCSDNPDTLQVVESALQRLWSVANTLSKIRPQRTANYSVTIFGSARIQPDDALYASVCQLARRLSEKGCHIVTGGGPGLMQAANEGSVRGDPLDVARSIGIRVALPFEKEANPYVEDAYTHETFFTRLHQFVRLSDAFVVVEGGIGTTLELFLVWQLLQVKHLSRDVPLILVGPMWKDLLAWAERHLVSHAPPLASAEDIELPICVDSVDEVMTLLTPRIEAHTTDSR
ncbi:MAG: LOG family protein [Myxococcota bacterium]